MPRPTWQPGLLCFSLIASALLYVSWFEWAPTRALWDNLDNAFFLAANASLEESPSWAGFWAIANNRSFDIVSALVFATLFILYIREGKNAVGAPVLERACAILLAALVVLAVTQAERMLLSENRPSPTMTMDSVFLLSENISWISTKDKSGNSFPSDHGTVAIMFTLFLAYFGGKRYALYGALATLVAVLPRLVGGAHWVTDITVGAAMIALPAVGVALATPCFSRAVHFAARHLRRLLPWAEPAFLALTDKPRILLTAKGACMGTADIIPGVSGSTMAYILGIYQHLLYAITRFNRGWLVKLLRVDMRGAVADIPLLFLLPLIMGMALAVVVFTRLIPVPYLLTAYPEPVYGLFFGLMVGSIILLCKKHARAHLSDFLLLAAGCALSYILVAAIPADTPDEPWFIFICGLLAILAMLLPGLSGSFILLVLGKYAMILSALGELDMTLLLPFISGCVTGLLCFSHLLHWILQRYHLMSMMIITGMLIGSLHTIWPFQYRVFEEIGGKERMISSTPHWPALEAPLAVTAATMLIGLLIVLALHTFAARQATASLSAQK